MGFPGLPDTFHMENGHKQITGSGQADQFILTGDRTTGHLEGGEGENTLDLSRFARNHAETLTVQLGLGPKHCRTERTQGRLWTRCRSATGQVQLGERRVELRQITRLIGRPGQQDSIHGACDTYYINGQGGSGHHPDEIFLRDEGCDQNTTLVLRPYTQVEHAANGVFGYLVPQGTGSITLQQSGISASSHFIYGYNLTDIESLHVDGQGTSYTLTFSGPLTLRVNATTKAQSHRLADGTLLYLQPHHATAVQQSPHVLSTLLATTPALAARLGMTLVVASQPDNTTLVIGSDKHEILPSNPRRKTYLIGGQGQAVYVITPKPASKDCSLEAWALPEIIIQAAHKSGENSTVVFKELAQWIEQACQKALQLQAKQDEQDLLLEASVKEELLATVRLKDALSGRSYRPYERVHVVRHTPLAIRTLPAGRQRLFLGGGASCVQNCQFALVPIPLTFGQNTTIVVMTAQDVEPNTAIIIPKAEGHYQVFRHDHDQMVSNDLALPAHARVHSFLAVSVKSVKN